MHNLDDMMRIAQDVAAGREPDETYTKPMKAMWHQMDAELDVARRQNPQVYFGFPTDVDGMPDAPTEPPRGTPRGDDFDESQHPRDPDGKFAPAGGGAAPNTGERKAAAKEVRIAKEKAKFGGTAGRAAEMKRRGEKAAAKRKENAEAKAAREAEAENKAREYQRANALARQQAGYVGYDQEERAQEALRQGQKEALSALSKERNAPDRSMGKTSAEIREKQIYQAEARAQVLAEWNEKHPGEPFLGGGGTMFGQEKLPGVNRSADADAKELHDRLAENLKANAKLGEHAKPEHEVEAEVRAAHEQVKVERAQAEQKAQAAAAERAAKAAARKEADAQLAAARDARIEAEVREEQAKDKWKEIGGKSGMTAQLAGAHQELKEAKRAALAAADKEMDAQSRRAALGSPVISRDSGPGGREELDKLTPERGKYLGGGINGTYKVTFADGTKATWKPVEGEHRARSNIAPGTYYLREAALSRVAPMLGVSDLVPASVAKEDHWATDKEGKDYGKGALNAWADGQTVYDSYNHVEFDRDAAERMRVADFVVGATDRHVGNVVVAEHEGRQIPVMIDNGLSLPNGTPSRFIQPWDNIPHGDGGKLLPSTHAAIQHIDTPSLVRELHAAGIEKEAARHTVMRAEWLKRNPDSLSVGRAPHYGDDAWETLAQQDFPTDIVSKANKITDEVYR